MASNNRCCCDCSGMGLPFVKTWLADKETWATDKSYIVGDLVIVSSNAQYYVCKLDHTSEAGTNDPVTDTGNTWWEDAERQLTCMYIELASIGMADCRILWQVAVDDPGIDLSTLTSTVRLDEVSGSPPLLAEKWLLRQTRKTTHPDLEDGSGTYSDLIGSACHWIKKCNCAGSDVYELKFGTTNAVNQHFLHRQDSVHTDFLIQVNILSATELEIVIFGFLQFMRSSAYDGNKDREDPPNHPPTTSDTPCKYGSAPSMQVEVFRGTGTIPANWIDNLGEPSTNLVVSNNYSCSDIGKRIFLSDLIATNDIWIAGGGGTVTIKPPFTDPWSIGDSVASCGSITSPPDSICKPTGGPEPPDPPTPPRPPSPCPFPPCEPGPGPKPPCPFPPCDPPPRPPKNEWRKITKCGGGETMYWVKGYAAGYVLKIQLVGGPTCVFAGRAVFTESPPGPILPGGIILNSYGVRGCNECLQHWDVNGCPSSPLGTIHTDVDLSVYEGEIVEVTSHGGKCGTVSKATDTAQTETVTIGASFDLCDDCADCCTCGNCSFDLVNSIVTIDYEKRTVTDDATTPDKGTTITGGELLRTTTCGLYRGTVTVVDIETGDETEVEHTAQYNCAGDYWESCTLLSFFLSGCIELFDGTEITTSGCDSASGNASVTFDNNPLPDATTTEDFTLTLGSNGACE